jgi:gluconokinase
MVVIVMGVSGAGKSTVGARLAERLEGRFYDADDLHPAVNVRKMAQGEPLTDRDRAPWLRRVHELILRCEEGDGVAVIACSALKESYRRQLLAGTAATRIVHLRVARDELERRLRARRDHFFDPALLASQLDTLEEPTDAIAVHGGAAIEAVVAEVVARLNAEAG